jgi:hypothetical protein
MSFIRTTMRGVMMAMRGGKHSRDVESLYWQFILSGVGTVAAGEAGQRSSIDTS